MTKERRLGRGLEALLGQLPGWNGAIPPGRPPAHRNRPAAPPADANSGPATIPIRPLDESPAAPRSQAAAPAADGCTVRQAACGAR